MYERLAVCMWASVSVRRAALCAASVSSWGGTVQKARVLSAAGRLANTARLRASSRARAAQAERPAWRRCGRAFCRNRRAAEAALSDDHGGADGLLQVRERRGGQPAAAAQAAVAAQHQLDAGLDA